MKCYLGSRPIAPNLLSVELIRCSLTTIHRHLNVMLMSTTRRINANRRDDAAKKVAGNDISKTLPEQAKLTRFFERALRLRGKLPLDINLEETRGRGHV